MTIKMFFLRKNNKSKEKVKLYSIYAKKNIKKGKFDLFLDYLMIVFKNILILIII